MRRLPWLEPDAPPTGFPPLACALTEPQGLLIAGGDLSTDRLRCAYARGIFPWYGPGDPILWWSPDPREVLLPAAFHCSKSLAKTLRSGIFHFTQDAAFERVIQACAQARGPKTGTWIVPEMQAAYIELHRLGLAHSVETWMGDELVGGLYGVHTGRVFSGESMFSRRDDASKAALAWLIEACPALGVELIDCQMPSAHLRSLGSQPMARAQFVEFLASRASETPADRA